MRGYNVEGSGWLEALLAAYPRRTLIRAKALWGLVMLISGDNPRQSRAIHLAKEAVSIARDFDDNVMIAWCLHALGRAQHTEKNFGPASSAFSESLERFEREGDDVGCAYSGWLLGVIARDSGDFEQAWLLFDAALRNAKRSEDPWSIAATILQTGVLAMAQKNFELAAEYLKESLVVFRKMNGRWGMLLSITRLMMVSARQGNAMRAVKLGGVAASLRQSVGADIGWGYRAEYEKDLDIAHTMLGDEAFSTAFEAGRNMEMDAALDYALSSEDESVEAASPFGTSL
jgi:tetratricopeptide (TPR) repeat protein